MDSAPFFAEVDFSFPIIFFMKEGISPSFSILFIASEKESDEVDSFTSLGTKISLKMVLSYLQIQHSMTCPPSLSASGCFLSLHLQRPSLQHSLKTLLGNLQHLQRNYTEPKLSTLAFFGGVCMHLSYLFTISVFPSH